MKCLTYCNPIECPFCQTLLPAILPLPLKKALKVVKARDRQYRDEQIEKVKQRSNGKSVEFLTKHMDFKRPVSNMEQYYFCRLHKIELEIKKYGKERGYPEYIDFAIIRERIERLRRELEQVIHGKVESVFRKNALQAYEDLGKNRARNTMSVMLRFDETLVSLLLEFLSILHSMNIDWMQFFLFSSRDIMVLKELKLYLIP